MTPVAGSERDGGYYAVKGFAFQFDKTLVEVLSNPDQAIEVEQVQDLSTASFYMQVKYKETQTYSPSKIKKALIQLLRDYRDADSGAYVLYAYFKDRDPEDVALSLQELDKILGKSKDEFTEALRLQFCQSFTLRFAEDFELQFQALVSLIRTSFSLKDDSEAVIYHATLRGHLIEIAIRQTRTDRLVSFELLQKLVRDNEKVVFELAHAKYLTMQSYFKYLKQEYFTFKRINVPNHERLFIIEIDDGAQNIDLVHIAQAVKNRYYIKDSSPAPYVCFTGVAPGELNVLKREIWSAGLEFVDGTHFNGDEFRPDDLCRPIHSSAHNKAGLKLVKYSDLDLLSARIPRIQVFAFSLASGLPNTLAFSNVKQFYISAARDILSIIT